MCGFSTKTCRKESKLTIDIAWVNIYHECNSLIWIFSMETANTSFEKDRNCQPLNYFSSLYGANL
jgi:hypothetical protein